MRAMQSESYFYTTWKKVQEKKNVSAVILLYLPEMISGEGSVNRISDWSADTCQLWHWAASCPLSVFSWGVRGSD